MEDVERELFGSAPFPVEMVRKALEPLARLAEDSPSDAPDTRCLYDGAFEGLSLGDARRARAALDAIRGAE